MSRNLPGGIKPADVHQWQCRRFGKSNPDRMDNPVWAYLVESGENAWSARGALQADEKPEATWCFDRMGQSETVLPDGSRVFIAGEHEDHYDPDFCIYNDVVVRRPDGSLEIYGYPKDVFRPTDFHTASLAGGEILLLGNLGYPEDRHPGTTQLYLLDVETFRVRKQASTGDGPGWISRHKAVLTQDKSAIEVEGGWVCRSEDPDYVENIDRWRLSLSDWRWQRLTKRNWVRYEFRRSDGELNHLWRSSVLRWMENPPKKLWADTVVELEGEIGKPFDVSLASDLFNPPVAHTKFPQVEDEFDTHRISINDVVVRFVEGFQDVTMTIEGELPGETVEQLTRDLVAKLSDLENTDWEVVPI